MTERRKVYRYSDGVRRTMIWDDQDLNKFTVKTEQDVEPVLDGIARDRETMRHGVNKLAARLPLFVVESLIHRGIYTDEDAFRKWLNGPEAEPFRVWRGVV